MWNSTRRAIPPVARHLLPAFTSPLPMLQPPHLIRPSSPLPHIHLQPMCQQVALHESHLLCREEKGKGTETSRGLGVSHLNCLCLAAMLQIAIARSRFYLMHVVHSGSGSGLGEGPSYQVVGCSPPQASAPLAGARVTPMKSSRSDCAGAGPRYVLCCLQRLWSREDEATIKQCTVRGYARAFNTDAYSWCMCSTP